MNTPLHATVAQKSPAMIKLDEEVKQRVLKGIEFLKIAYGEDWVEHIDLKMLDLAQGDACVLGQVHPAYHGIGEYGEDGYEEATDMFGPKLDPIACGFLDGDGVGYESLDEAWQEAIGDEKRRYERKKAMEAVSCESSASTTTKAAS